MSFYLKILILSSITINAYCQTAMTNVKINAYRTGENEVLNFYQDYISPVKGGNTCPMYPSCSQYAKNALVSRNVISAFIDISDRLIRCGHDLEENYSLIYINETPFFYDPVENLHDTIEKSAEIDISDNINHNTNFAHNLLLNDEYDLALLEYKRLLFVEKNGRKKENLYNNVIECYYLKRDYSSLNRLYSDLIFREFEDESVFDSISLFQAKANYKGSNYLNSNIVLNTIKDSCFQSEVYFLKGLNYIGLKEWDNAENNMKMVLNTSSYYSTSKTLYRISDEIDSLPKKKPWVATVASIAIPGSGYFYTNRKATAIAAMLINGLFIWTSYEAYNNRNYALGITSSILGFGWYVGSVSGSRKAVIQFNQRQENNYLSTKLQQIKL